MISEHANFIRNSRKFLHCGECGRPFDNDTHKPRVLKCGHNVCEPCTTTQRLSTGARCCLICDASRSDRSAPLSHDLLGIVQGKEQALKRIPLKYRCGECSTLYKENDMTVCRTCSGWSEGMQTEEATDFAKRPISSLLCWMCATHSRHATHDKMSIEIVNRIWDTPIAIEYVETQLGTAEKLLELLHGGAIRQIKTLTDDFSEKLEVLKLKISTGQFPLDSTLHIKKAVDVISSQIRHWNLGIQKSSEDARLLLEYFGALVKHVSDTPNKNGNSKWEPPVTRPTDADDTDLRVLIKKNIRELREAMPIADSMKLSESPEREQEDVRAPERSSETTTTVTSSEVAVEPVVRVIKRRNHSHPVPYFLTEDYLDRPRRTTKKNYALEDEMESEMVPKKRTRQKRENGEATSSELSPYNLTGTHLENDPLLNAPPSTAVAAPRRGTSRRGRGRRRGGFRGGRGSRGGYRHLAVASINPPDTDQPPHEPLFDADLDALHGDMGESFELEESDSEPEHDGVGSHEATPEPPQRTTEELFQELTGIGPSTSNGTNGNANNNSAVSSASSSSSSSPGGGPSSLSSSSKMLVVASPPPPPPPQQQQQQPPPPKIHHHNNPMPPVDFLGPTSGPRDIIIMSNSSSATPFGDGFAKKQLRPWEEVSQADRYGHVADYYQKSSGASANTTSTALPAQTPVQSFINNTPPY